MLNFLWVYLAINVLLGAAIFYLRSNEVLLLILLVAMAAAGMVLFLFLNGVSRRVQQNVETITKGQLNLNVRKTKFGMFDSIANKINDFLFKIRGLIASFGDISKRVVKDAREIEKQAETIKLASGEIAATVQNITESVSNQAAYTRNMMDMIQSFASGAKDISENAETSLRVAKETKTTIIDSFERFKDIKQKIQESKAYNDKVLNALKSLDDKIREINSITEAVESIASQTQLLSLNAAIEAARAGESGRGFAVVASEVGKLAVESSQSAKGIKQLIDGIIGQISELSVHIKDEAAAIDENFDYATEVLKKSDAINDTLESNMEAARKITVLTKEQLTSLNRIEGEIQKINDVTQQNAAVSEEISASTEEQFATIEAIHGHIVTLMERLEESNAIVGNFMKGFQITDNIRTKIESVKGVLNEIAKEVGLFNLDEKSARMRLEEYMKKTGFIELIAILDSKGYVKAATVDLPDNLRDCSAKPYYMEACKGETYVSEEYISTATNNYNISVCTPVKVDGVLQGLILADININEA